VTEPTYPTGPPLTGDPRREPGWQADPAGRHQFRYWDGSQWTDHVADQGVLSTEPLGPAPPAPTAPTQPAYPPSYYYAPAPAAAPPARRRRSKVPLVIGLLAVVALLAAGTVYVLASRGDGSGTFARELEDRGSTLSHPIRPPDDSVVLIRVSSDDERFDPVIGVSASPELIDHYVDFFGSEASRPADEFPGAIPEGHQLLAVADGFGAGEDEVTFVGIPFGGDFEVLVTGSGDSTGAFDLEITFEEFDGPDDAEAYVEELANQDFVQDFEPPQSPIDDILDDFIDEGADQDD
jgi:Protein of unknown function (DUF2510)